MNNALFGFLLGIVMLFNFGDVKSQDSLPLPGAVSIHASDPREKVDLPENPPAFVANSPIPLFIMLHNLSTEDWHVDYRTINLFFEYDLINVDTGKNVFANYRGDIPHFPSAQLYRIPPNEIHIFNINLFEIFIPSIKSVHFTSDFKFPLFNSILDPAKYRLIYRPFLYGKGTEDDAMAPEASQLLSEPFHFVITDPDPEGFKVLDEVARNDEARIEDRTNSFVRAVYIYPRMVESLINHFLHSGNDDFVQLAERARANIAKRREQQFFRGANNGDGL